MSALLLTPSKTIKDVQTLFVNTSGKTHVFGYLPPHGKSLAAGATKLFDGDFRTLRTHKHGPMSRRELDHLTKDVNAGLCQFFVYERLLLVLAGRTASPIAVGDMLWFDTSGGNLARPAAEFTWNTDLPTTQTAFVNQFLGIAATAKAAATAGNIAVDVSPQSVYLMTCSSQTNQPGDVLGPAKDTGNALLSQTIVKAAAAADGCFRSLQQDAGNVTSVLVNLQSAYWGANAAAQQ